MKNVGSIDRLIRIILGLAIIAAGIIYSSWWGLLGVVLLLTGVFRSCLLYKPFGINTASKES